MNYSTVGRRRLLNEQQIAEIREWYRTRMTIRSFAKKYGVGVTAIQNAINGYTYKQAVPK